MVAMKKPIAPKTAQLERLVAYATSDVERATTNAMTAKSKLLV